MIQLINLSRVYCVKNSKKPVVALDHIALEINKDDHISIMGKSGSGKTTLLNLLGGADYPTEGKVIVDGRDIYSLSMNELARYRNQSIGFVFQSFCLEPSLTALDNVMLPLIARKLTHTQRITAARSALERVGLENRVLHKPYELAGGEQQRVSIARAIVTEPKILLADEPTGNLDERTGKEILQVLNELMKDRCLILVTHDKDVAATNPRQIFLHDGKIVTDEKQEFEKAGSL